MAERKAYLLRLDPALHDALARWAADELRSLNGQIEYLLKHALEQSGRVQSSSSDHARSAHRENKYAKR